MHPSRPHRRSHHGRSQRPNADERASPDTRRHRRTQGGYDDRTQDIENEQPFDPTMIDDQLSGWQSPGWTGDTAIIPSFNNSVFNPYAASCQVTMLGDSMLDSSSYYHTAPEDTARLAPMAVYEASPHFGLLPLVPPITSSTMDGAPPVFPVTSCSEMAPDPLSEYQSGISGASSVQQSWVAEAVAAPERTFRRSSTRACQGSAMGSPNVDEYGGMVVPDPVLGIDGMEGHDYSDSSGSEITPVELDRYVMCGDDPWSPEFPHQNPSYQYPGRFDQQLN